jgi:predicted nucleic acid-binding protein
VCSSSSPIPARLTCLILIGHIEILPSLFKKVILPSVVRDELTDAPSLVRRWIADPPPWVEVRKAMGHRLAEAFQETLDAGEEDAIALAVELHADLV